MPLFRPDFLMTRLFIKTLKMERRKRDKKFNSLSSPRGLKGFPKGKCLRAEALGWNGWKNSSLEANQSFPAELPTRTEQMDWFRGEASCVSFSSRKWPVNQSPIHISSSRDESWLLNETGLNSSTHPSNSAFEASAPLPNSSKAVFTLLVPSTQILVVNAVACKLLGYTSEELCAMTLKSLLADPQQIFSLFDVSDQPNFGTGTVLEMTTRDGLRVPVYLFLNKVDNPQRCVAVAELVDRRVATLTVNGDEKIVSCDEEVVTMFQYENGELIGLPLKQLIPSINFTSLDTTEKGATQRLTGKTKAGASFPLCLLARYVSSDEWHIILWVYSNLSGVIVINGDLSIANCNHLFTTLLFGYSKDCLLSQSLLRLLPGFWEDLEYERERTVTGESSNFAEPPSPDDDRNEAGISIPMLSIDDSIVDKDCTDEAEDYLKIEVGNTNEDCVRLMNDLKLDSLTEDDANVSVIGDSDLELQNEMTEKLAKMNHSCHCPQKRRLDRRLRSSRSDDILAKARPTNLLPVVGASSNLDIHGTGLKEFPMNRALNISNLSDPDNDEVVRAIREGTFAGRGRHRDGAEIDVVYRVTQARRQKGYFVCIARDPWEVAEGGRGPHLNLTITSSFNSTSMEASLTKDSEHQSRPHSASIISQSDDSLTLGEYSDHYTNLKQIGKGAFGYVKMAYRKSDGLLVITKFIKKFKVHTRGWVRDPERGTKMPLEVCLLTHLDHPNIVRLLDVFHNDNFFQMVMEKHGAGMDLFEFIDRKPKMDEKLTSYIFRQITSAVHFLHLLGILHRDIKDENVIIDEKFHVKLIDFGSAAFMQHDKKFSTFYGTVEYCSPEVLQGNDYKGPELEVWALGVTLYVLTFGENPFYDVEETIKGEFVIPRAISSDLFSLIKGMLEKDVSLRWDMVNIVIHPWVKQPVDPTKYTFEKVVRCYHDEANPAKYLSEYADKDDLMKDDEDDDRTVASSNSFCSLHTIENLDDPQDIQDVYDPSIVNEDLPRLSLAVPAVVRSSTPVRTPVFKSVSSTNKGLPSPAIEARKRYSLDMSTLKMLRQGKENLEQPETHCDISNKPKSIENDGSHLQFYDSLEHKTTIEDFEKYWDAEDEELTLDSS